jgi:uncharacterized delta-60 repeat protein
MCVSVLRRRWRRGLLAACLLGAMAIATPAAAAPGDLDRSFGTGGAVFTNFFNDQFGPSQDIANAILILPNGKILAGGRTGSGPGYPKRTNAVGDFALAQYRPDGSLDRSFGRDGLVVTNFTPDRDQIRTLAVQPDGKILAGGFVNSEFGGDSALVRYLPNGRLDPSFGSGGAAINDLSRMGIGDGLRELAILPDGKILAAGVAGAGACLVRYLPDGRLDPSFGDGGEVVAPQTFGHFFAMKVVTGGKIAVAGQVNSDFVVARFNPDGTPDSSFGTGGVTSTDFAGLTDIALSLLVQGDGKLVAVGWSGGLDAFGASGDAGFALARYNLDGTLDSSFGQGGKVVYNPTPLMDGLLGAALQPDGKIVGAGVEGANDLATPSDPAQGDSAVARFNPDGSLDTTFGQGGTVTTDFSSYGEEAEAVTQQSDGRILTAGAAFKTPTDMDFVVARYQGGTR